MRTLVVMLLLGSLFAVNAAETGHEGHNARVDQQDRDAAWTDLPLIAMLPGRDRSAVAFRLSHLSADAVTAYAPSRQAPLPEGIRFKTDQLEWEIPVQQGRFALQAAGVGNYHWLQAREETPESVKVASTVYYFSNPGPAPTAMLARPKSELEIVPTPLPREHNQYRAGEAWDFSLRFRGQPLPNATLKLVSQAGTQVSFTSDPAGRVRVRFPADIKPRSDEHTTHRRGVANHFALAVEHTADSRHYLTAFNGRYSEDAFAQRSLLWGGGFLVLGGLLGLPLVVRRKENHHA